MSARGLVAMLLASSLPAVGANLGRDVPFANFSDKDRAMFEEALDRALDKGADGAALAWSNPETKAHGEIKPTKTFERAGSPCRTLTIANNAKGRSATGPYTFCKSDGKWALTTPDAPKAAKKDGSK